VSIRDLIAPLEALSAIDVELRRVEEQLDKQQSGLSGMRSEVKSLEDRVKADRETLAEMDKTRGDLMGEIRQMTSQIERSREKLQRSRNERESNAAQREVEELRKLHRDREEELERLSSAADAARGAIDDADKKRVALTAQLNGSAEGIATSLSELESEKARLTGLRAVEVQKLPSTLYRKYESIRTRRPVAIAKTHDGTCLGCHLAVPPAMFQKMRRQAEFEQCPQCRRILYYVPPGEGGPPASADSSRA
jgi:predicted  nucleic acid-binding Zn-ribbon protein